jgi:hypothetical protein
MPGRLKCAGVIKKVAGVAYTSLKMEISPQNLNENFIE